MGADRRKPAVNLAVHLQSPPLLLFLAAYAPSHRGVRAEEHLGPLVVEVGALCDPTELGKYVLRIAELVSTGDFDVIHCGNSWPGPDVARLRFAADRAE